MTPPPSITARDAIDELRAIRSTDPCAGRAVSAVKAAILTLERYWPDEPDEPDDPDGQPVAVGPIR